MKKKLSLGILAVVFLAVLAVLYTQFIDKRPDAAQEVKSPESNIDHYTCTMHPSVKAKDPGNCPICGMKLTPVYKKSEVTRDEHAEHQEVDLTFAVSPVKQQLIGVTFSPAEYRTIEKVIRAVGRIDMDERKLAVVNLRVGGWIQDLLVDFTGKYVEKGQPLFTLYSPELVSAQEEYLLALRAREDTAWSVEATLGGGRLLETSRERLRLWGMTDSQIDQLRERGKPETNVAIHSPISGYVIEKNAIAGMRVEPMMMLYKIADLSTVWVYADVYEYELSSVRLHQGVSVTVGAYPNEIFRGRITYIAPNLDPLTRTVRVRVELPNRDGKLKPEMYGNVEIGSNLGRKLVLPTSAILRTGTRDIVFVNKGDGIFEVRLVKLGVRSEGYYEIVEGVKKGESVVSSANFLFDAESRVQGVLERLQGEQVSPPPQHKH